MELPRFFCVLGFSLLLGAFSPVSARIGDSQRDLERRLLRESDRGLEVTDNDLESYYRSRGPILSKIQVLEDEDVEYVIYYKSSGDQVASSNRLWKEDQKGRRSTTPEANPEGWMLHVLYLNNVSVLEYYSRSQSLTEVEIEGVLLRNAGESHWIKGKPKGGDSVIEAQVFPVDHYREDREVYAKVDGRSILLFNPRLDQRIHQLSLEKAQREAPDSLDGF